MKLKKAVGNHGRPIFILFFYSFASLFLGFWASTRGHARESLKPQPLNFLFNSLF
ncbi:hypothetical protein ES288_D12G162700v1 [Gossypium darwinii]|uniref:Uncharacterized protein n=1 Tax=Gossypium darwinii TaxID=34276 RepID=A0A5D2AA38_GOSDA|nr:hypothetical protein ES288_D12G162700v1 [Gossypium darwinii]